MWSFDVVVLWGTTKKCTKVFITHVQSQRFTNLNYCFLTFSLPSLSLLFKVSNNVKKTNSSFGEEREHMTVNCSFTFLTRTPRLPIWFLGNSQFLYTLDELKYSQSSTDKMKLYFQVRFLLPSPSSLLKVPSKDFARGLAFKMRFKATRK